MLNSSNILTLIQEDAPCVYDILRENCMDYHNGFISENPDWWAQLSDDDKADLLLEQLTEYSGDNHDVHYWSWRYAQMIEIYNSMEDMIRVLEENKQKFAPFMSEEYQLRIDTIKNVQEFICQP